jgi:phage terminase small subunit
MTEKTLTDKATRFVDEYLVDLNATQAAIRAGYSKTSAYSIGCENLTKPDIQNEISQRQKDLQKKTKITTERVLAEYAKIAFSNLTDIVDYATGTISIESFKNLTPEQKHCIKKIKFVTVVQRGSDGEPSPVERVEIELFDKQRSLDSLARHLAMFDGKAEADDYAPTIYNITYAGEKPKDE